MTAEIEMSPASSRTSFAGPAPLRLLDQGIGLVTELLAAVLVVVEILVLLSGVIARYALHSPIVWSDEVASILFLWLTMLGAVIALRRDEHMRFTVLLSKASPTWRRRLQGLATVAVLAYLLLVIVPAHEYVQDEWFVQLPTLEISKAISVIAFETGIVLMLAVALIRLVRETPWLEAAGLIAAVAGLGLLLWLASPALIAIGNANLLVFFVLLVGAGIFLGVPIGFAFGVSTLAYLSLITDVPLTVVVNRTDEGMSHFVLLSVPLFIFLGLLIEITGLARWMVAFLASLLGSVRGGLDYVLLGAMILVSGISGSKAADMAAIAPVLLPEMKKRGAKPGELVALLSSSAVMADSIPPSLVLIMLGSVTGISIAALFAAGLIPALIMAVALAAVAWWRARKEPLPVVPRASRREIVHVFLMALPALVLPFVIRFAVVEGIATATEVSTLGIVYTFIAGLLIYRPINWARIYPALVETAALSGAILFIIGTATSMAWALTQSGFSDYLAQTMAAVPGGRVGFIAITIVAFILLGNILEGIPALLLFAPLLFPVAKEMGINEVYYAMVVILAMSIGLFAPPFGVGFYSACAIGRVAPDEAVGYIGKYLIALIVALVIVACFPILSTILI
jgi:tripartite ATP-independent transporter DctM subunit